MANRKTFSAIFFNREYRELAGKHQRVTLLLAFLLLLTFCALGFALGGYAQLRERMDNPFTRWVDISMGGRANDYRDELEDFLDKTLAEGTHNLAEVNDWNRYYLNFHKRRHDGLAAQPDEDALPFTGRTIGAFDDALFAQIIHPDLDNVRYLSPTLTAEDGLALNNCALVVTARMMKRLGYSPEDYENGGVNRLSLAVEGSEEQTFVELYAVVESLPSRSEFLSLPHPYNIFQTFEVKELLELNKDTSRTGPRYLLGREAGLAGALKVEMADYFKLKPTDFNTKETLIEIDGEKSYTLYELSRALAVPKDSFLLWLATKTETPAFADYAYCECADKAKTIERPDHRMLNFASLDGIRGFQEALYESVGLKIPMEQVENWENFRLVADLTSILSGTLFLFGLLSIVLYLVNLLNNHVDNIRPHLGTFKAMGLPNGQLLSVYTRIALRLLLTATAIALPLAALLGYVLSRYVLEVGFTLWHYAIPLAIGLILAVVCLLVVYRLRGVFATTPGDLIYERE